ncbi:MAG: PepSY-like domain-containing protein [Rikenellaceae bacterium]|nr:PepSY-like domain-containing protein [Rikenellaceae bacterium]
MKKLIAITLALFAVSLSAQAGNKKAITVNQLPAAAQQFLAKNFAGHKVAIAKEDKGLFSTTYEVVFTNLDEVEFDSSGQWKEIECKNSHVPGSVMPEAINRYVETNYPNVKVKSIEREPHKYEVKLKNKVELTFDSQFNIIDID